MLTHQTLIKLSKANTVKQLVVALKKCAKAGETLDIALTTEYENLVIEKNRILNKYFPRAYYDNKVSSLVKDVLTGKVSQEDFELRADDIKSDLRLFTPLADVSLVNHTAPNSLVIVYLSKELNYILKDFSDALASIKHNPRIDMLIFFRLALQYIEVKHHLISQVVYGGW